MSAPTKQCHRKTSVHNHTPPEPPGALRWLSEQSERHWRYGTVHELEPFIRLLRELRDGAGYAEVLTDDDIIDVAQGRELGFDWTPES